ncbi:LVIVD repeat-containing protein [Salsuginibacillus kocurii]|uniref:LVIVD repeat-containing protein n=1 Tax=Salsuginibacillus kocurii TaxID=427078 RepID=UPI000376539B|nr:hypothetical protein [Salsuginibacillus kocurii]
MKKKTIVTSAVAGGLTVGLMLSSFASTSEAHDWLGGDLDKWEDDYGDIDFQGEVIEGDKNMKFLHEAAAKELEPHEDGYDITMADVYAHQGYAYTGTHVSAGNNANGGVHVFDLQDPSNPEKVAQFADEIPGTWQEKVIVKTVNTPDFRGDLAVVSVQQTDRDNPDSKGGFLLYDVTTPEDPERLGFWEVDKRTNGTHELYLTTQGNRPLVLTANPYADFFTEGESKDFQLVDVSDPSNPETIYEFDPRELDEVEEEFNGYNWNAPDGNERPVFAHSAITNQNGTKAFLSFWDLGTVILDISNPDNPEYLGRTDFASDQQGAAHSAALARGGNVLIETREVSNPTVDGYEEGYGYTRIFDIKDPSSPALLSEFKTELVDNIEDGTTFANTVHDPKVRGNTLYLSHYAGGVRAVDITNPASPEQVGQYVPEESDIWGVFVDRNYILASDMGTGLKVLERNNRQN